MECYGDEEGKQDVTGRKIDSIIGGRNIGLSSSEWKKENTTARQGIIQDKEDCSQDNWKLRIDGDKKKGLREPDLPNLL